MGERREGSPRQEIVRSSKVEDSAEEASIRDQISQLQAKLEKMLEDPDIQEGKDAALRALINAMLVVADTIPLFGDVASAGADLAKIWARMEYTRKRKEAEEKGEDPDKIKLSSIDLTPDVPVAVAVLANVFNLIPFAPAHAVEASLQLFADRPKLTRAFERVREIFQERIEASAQEVEAAHVMDVEFTTVSSKNNL